LKYFKRGFIKREAKIPIVKSRNKKKRIVLISEEKLNKDSKIVKVEKINIPTVSVACIPIADS